jgi:hypothetical protein
MNWKQKPKQGKALWTKLKKYAGSTSGSTVIAVGFPKSRSKVRAVSASRAKHLRLYSKLAQQFKLDHPKCACCGVIWFRPAKATTEVHHRQGRRGKLLLDQRFWTAACAQCHRYIHNHPTQTRKLGLLGEVGTWNNQLV